MSELDWTWAQPEPPKAQPLDWTWAFPPPPTTAQAAQDELRQLKKNLFLQALAENPNVGAAITKASVESRQTVYRWRDQDPQFATDWDQAYKIGVGRLKDVASERAQAGTNDKHSASLLMFMIKGYCPEFKDGHQININTGAVPLKDALQEAEERNETYSPPEIPEGAQ